jgi:hypothetical protein
MLCFGKEAVGLSQLLLPTPGLWIRAWLQENLLSSMFYYILRSYRQCD